MTRLFTRLLTASTCLLFALGCSEPAAPAPGDQAAAPAAVDQVPSESEIMAAALSPLKIQFMNYDEVQRLIKSHEGKVVVMDCWSTWCEPCKKEFPGLVELHEKYGADKIACISLCLDYEGLKKETPEEHEPEVRQFLERQDADFDNVISTVASDEMSEKLGIATVPAIFVYNQQGELAQTFKTGGADDKPFTYKEVGETVAGLLKDEG